MNPGFVSRRPPREIEKKERNPHQKPENRRISACREVEKKWGTAPIHALPGKKKGTEKFCPLGVWWR